MPRHGDAICLAILLVLGGALLLNDQGEVIGRAKERPGGIDLFDAHSNYLGWGRQHRNNDVELFDTGATGSGPGSGTVARFGWSESRERADRWPSSFPATVRRLTS